MGDGEDALLGDGDNDRADDGTDQMSEGANMLVSLAAASTASAPAAEPSASAPRRSRGRPRVKELEEFTFSITIQVDGGDLDIDRCRTLLAPYLMSTMLFCLMSVERGEVEHHLHLQGVGSVATTSGEAFKKAIKKALNYGTDPGQDPTPAGFSICLKKLTGRGLHTRLGVIGYCRKYLNQPHYEEL